MKSSLVIYSNPIFFVLLKTLWLTQAKTCERHQTSRTNVVEPIKPNFEEEQLQEEATCRTFRQVSQQAGNVKAEYGKGIIDRLSKRLTAEYGGGFSTTNIRYMRQFYLYYPIRHTVCDKLSWSHYRHLIRVENTLAHHAHNGQAFLVTDPLSLPAQWLVPKWNLPLISNHQKNVHYQI